jgi:hypothetical protein
MIAVGGVSAIMNLNLTWTQYLQILLYNACMAAMIVFLYGLALAIPVKRGDGGLALIRMILFVFVIVYVVPAFLESFCDLVYCQLPRGWRAEWYWYSRYLRGFDIFGSYSELTSDILYPGRARVLYASLPWTENLVGAGPISIGQILIIQWFRWITMTIWVIFVYIMAKRRFQEADVV